MGGWNKGKVLINWEYKVRDKFGDSFRVDAPISFLNFKIDL